MSDYLIRAIQTASNITVRCGIEVVDGSGDRQLRQLTLRERASGATEVVRSNALFVKSAPSLTARGFGLRYIVTSGLHRDRQ